MTTAILYLLAQLFGCQPTPTIAGSAQPSSVNTVAPMASETSNAEFEKRLALLNGMLNAEISMDDFEKSKGNKNDRLYKVIESLGLDNLPKKMPAGSKQRDALVAQFYFYERRFIEASHIFSRLLDKEPGWLSIRNLLARCFYFLGNTDRSFLELSYVITHHDGQAEELLDALFLMGAIALDSHMATKEQIEKGKGAWETYLKLAPTSPLKERIEEGLKSYETKLKLATKTITNTGDLKKDALFALENADTMTAENNIKSALKRFPQDEELKVALARVYVKTGRVKEALDEFNKILMVNSRCVLAYHYQGMAFMMAQDPKNAVASWEKVLELDPDYGEKFSLGGRILIAKNLIGRDRK